jgi:hypothetical protein
MLNFDRKLTEEEKRLAVKSSTFVHPWKKWGAYLSERSWGTVREDYSANGDAWNYLTHEMSRSVAYRWGEDGIAGFSDYFQSLAFCFAFWNGEDPILKERLFGLNPSEGNHGEDVKECYYYLDATPTQSYLKYLYKYPQKAFPYERLVEENKKRSSLDPEFELIDTGIFDEGEYFDIFIEYAKADLEDICMKVEVWNRGKKPAKLDVLPQLWFRNRWSWQEKLLPSPTISIQEEKKGITALFADATHCLPPLRTSFAYENSSMYFYGKTPRQTLFTNNETHAEKVWKQGAKSLSPYVKDAFHRYIIQKEDCVSKEKGSKACFHYDSLEIDPEKPAILLFRLSSKPLKDPLKDVEEIIARRKKEADLFYESVQPSQLSLQDKQIQRAALAGMIWSQQLYIYDVKTWLQGDNPIFPPAGGRGKIRNGKWSHLYGCDVISMPDKWEYPWFAAWDLSFQSLALSLVDPELAKFQLTVLLEHWFQHVNGQIPAYEWNFSDLNPPVQAWGFWKLYSQEKNKTGKGDRNFLLFGFLKLVQNFSWWVNKVDKFGNNCFEGGFLGLDNISVIDRSQPLPGGEVMEQSDATGWMGFYSLLMMRIALELAKEEPLYATLATNFLEQFIYISRTIHETRNMWDEEDGFFYDVIVMPDKRIEPLKVRSFVGIIPFYSLISLEESELKAHPLFYERFIKFREYNQKDVDRCVLKTGSRVMFSLIDVEQMKKILARVFDSDEFLSDFGLRSVSKYHEKYPLHFDGSIVGYEPGESIEKIKGGNSNWRGPIWFPTNYLTLEAIKRLMECVGEDFVIEDLKGTSRTLKDCKCLLENNLIATFRKNEKGVRPVHGKASLYHQDPFWKDLILFYEHYHGDTGRGLGASHQTGWSGLVANILQSLD